MITLSKKYAFTLAEVLITLGIIGVVAALTIPTLMQSQTNKFTETSLAKFYSIINQAVNRSVVDNGPYEYWDFTELNELDEEGTKINKNEIMDQKFNKYFGKYLNIISKDKFTTQEERELIVYFLSDGSAFSFNGATNVDINYYPKNAKKCIETRPTSEANGSCFFRFNFHPNPTLNVSEWKYTKAKGVVSYSYNWDGQNLSLYNDSHYGCTPPGYGSYCTKVIEQNGWKIPTNYPRKIKY